MCLKWWGGRLSNLWHMKQSKILVTMGRLALPALAGAALTACGGTGVGQVQGSNELEASTQTRLAMQQYWKNQAEGNTQAETPPSSAAQPARKPVPPADSRAVQKAPEGAGEDRNPAETKEPGFFSRVFGTGGATADQDQEAAAATSKPLREEKTEAAPPQQVAAPATKPSVSQPAVDVSDLDLSGDFMTASWVPGKEGRIVFSPYSGRHVNVEGVQAGMLVADPRFPLESRKYFVVPQSGQ